MFHKCDFEDNLMPQRTNPFQKLTATIFSVFHEPEYEVVESVLMQNPRTGVTREIDIKVMNRSNPIDRFMIECRAHKRRQDVQWIDALEGKSKSISKRLQRRLCGDWRVQGP